uniref:G-protein coupled receptors family 1 profile domain-containing protein n=1 Tax=Plectus sambesii TaxID=2011161 RepID=A0A914V731_9BILA
MTGACAAAAGGGGGQKTNKSERAALRQNLRGVMRRVLLTPWRVGCHVERRWRCGGGGPMRLTATIENFVSPRSRTKQDYARRHTQNALIGSSNKRKNITRPTDNDHFGESSIRRMTAAASERSNHTVADSTFNETIAVFPTQLMDTNFTSFCAIRKTAESLIVTVAFTTIFCLSVVGNSVVIVTIVQQRTMRTITNLYLLNLAITDLLLSVICMPPTLVSSLVYCWIFGPILCKVIAYLQPVAVAASAYTLAVIAIERYYAICRPLHSRLWQTKGHAAVMISLVWTISFLANIGALYLYEMQPYAGGYGCSLASKPAVQLAYQIYLTTVLLVVPLVLMIALYGYVIHTLQTGIRNDFAVVTGTNGQLEVSIDDDGPSRKTSLYDRIKETLRLPGGRSRFSTTSADGARCPTIILNKSTPPNSECMLDTERSSKAISRKPSAEQPNVSLRSTHSEKALIAKKRVIRMLLVIVVIFFFCWTPSYIWWLLIMIGDSFKTFNIWNSDVNTVITIMTYLSSCTNPITYCFLNNKFRQAFIMSFGCRKVAMRHHIMHKASAPNSSVYQNPNAVAVLKPLNGTRKMNTANNNALLNRSNARPKDRAGFGRNAAEEERRSSMPPVEARGLLAKEHNEHCSPDHEALNQPEKVVQSTVELRTAGSADDVLDRSRPPPPRKESAV